LEGDAQVLTGLIDDILFYGQDCRWGRSTYFHKMRGQIQWLIRYLKMQSPGRYW